MCLPGLFSGAIWAAGMICWLLSAIRISQAIASPIASVLVASITSMWSVFYFKEIESGRSLYLLVVAVSLATIGSIVMSLSTY
ncbi:transmembrane family of transporters domain-containing protein [Ditylenchus destructor]|nr:transmembrane family of transporters domain-containing protein [Ditylenchus destructor]